MGSANNKGIKLCKTDYAFVINHDVKFYKNTIDELITLSSKHNDYSILAPISDDIKYPNYKIKNKKLQNNDLEFLSVDSVDGYAMLINKNKFQDNFFFDENFFLYLENDDLCLRTKKKTIKYIYQKKQKLITSEENLILLCMKEKLNFNETGIGCGQNFILIKNILVI